MKASIGMFLLISLTGATAQMQMEAEAPCQRLERLRKIYEEEIHANPNSAEAICKLASTYINPLDKIKAEELFKKALELDPNCAEAYNGLGRVSTVGPGCLNGYVFSEEPYKRAIEFHKQAINLNPNFADAYRGLGSAYSWLKNYKESARAYEEAIRLNPDIDEALESLSRVYLELERYEDSLRICETLIQRHADYALYKENDEFRFDEKSYYYDMPLYRSGLIYMKLGRYEKALEAFKQRVLLNYNDIHAHHYLGLIYAALNDKESAMAEYAILMNFMNIQSQDYGRQSISEMADEIRKKIQNLK